MPARLWFLLSMLCAAILAASCLALWVGTQEVRLHRAGPLRPLLAADIGADTKGWVQVLGCARHDLEVAINSDGRVVTGERDPRDRVYYALTAQDECDDAPPTALHVRALVEAQDAGNEGLSRLYGRGYQPPPTRVVVDGVIGYGAGDGWREFLARKALAAKFPAVAALRTAPLLVKGKRPGSPAAAYATAAVGLHGLLLLAVLGALALRRRLRRDLPTGFTLDGDDLPAET